MNIMAIKEPEEKKRIARTVLEALPEWFGLAQARASYIAKAADQLFWCAYESEHIAGFLYLYETGKDTVELYVMGVRREYHRQGIGSALFHAALEAAKAQGYSFLQVKTVQMGRYAEYDATNRFYLSLGFKEFEVFPALWDEWNPCQVYVLSLA